VFAQTNGHVRAVEQMLPIDLLTNWLAIGDSHLFPRRTSLWLRLHKLGRTEVVPGSQRRPMVQSALRRRAASPDLRWGLVVTVLRGLAPPPGGGGGEVVTGLLDAGSDDGVADFPRSTAVA
jgi:hypothetical protein